MSYATHAIQGPPTQRQTRCSVGILLAALPDDERAGLQAMLDDKAWSQAQIFDQTKREGHVVGLQSINRHRRAECGCFR